MSRQKHTWITQERLDKFLSDTYWVDCNLFGALYPSKSRTPVSHLSVYSVPEAAGRVPFADAIKGPFTAIAIGFSMGPAWSTHWVRFELCEIEENSVLMWETGCEGMLYDTHGRAIKGLVSDPNRVSLRTLLPGTYYIEVACNTMFGNGNNGMINPPNETKSFTIAKAEVALCSVDAIGLFRDLTVLHDLSKIDTTHTVLATQALFVANEIINVVTCSDPSTFAEGRRIAATFFALQRPSGLHAITAVGHCHIDTAWLWPYCETRRKIARSWATQLFLHDEMGFSSHKFATSQALHYQWLSETDPALFARAVAAVKKGVFEVVASTWVELDGLLPGGESMFRQFLYGQKYCQKTFGEMPRVFWLPDTFGYAGQIPQIASQCGVSYFLTQKLSWNLMNKPPHNTFWWEGLDGSRLLTHFPPANDYNSQMKVNELVNIVTNHKDKDRTTTSLLLFGNGDGGGGPTMEMMESLARIRRLDGLPEVTPGTAHGFFDSLPREHLLTHVGELYFEMHRGTYTTQANAKKGNRRLESLLRETELLAVLAYLKSGNAYYPTETLETVWKEVLLHQFHDVLPGSSIGMVYDDVAKSYASCITTLQEVKRASREALGGGGGNLWMHNALDSPRSVMVSGSRIIVPPLYCGPCAMTPIPDTERVRISQGMMENATLRVSWNPAGFITSVYHKKMQRECVRDGETIGFVMYDDVPLYWDAWDVEAYHLQKPIPIDTTSPCERISLDCTGGRGVMSYRRSLTPNCLVSQKIILEAFGDCLVFETTVEWKESHRILKARFPFVIRSPMATYDTQFGHVTRPTHANTTHDVARFEVPCQKWGDLSEFGFGVAILNDCKYGMTCHGSDMTLSLLRSPKRPDPDADMGTHTFTYALLPHSGSFQTAGVIRRANELNLAVENPTFPSGGEEGVGSSLGVTFEDAAVVIESVKKAEEEDGVVIRVYESFGSHVKGTFTISAAGALARRGVRSVHVADGLERVQRTLSASSEGPESTFAVPMTPFQIVTILIKLL